MEVINLHIVGGTSSKGHKLQCENSELFSNNEFCDAQKLRQIVTQNNPYNGRKGVFKLNVLSLRCLYANWGTGRYSKCFKDYHNNLNY